MTKDAIIDVAVTCMRCGRVLYSGGYYSGIIGKLKRKIHREGWRHDSSEGTLCPDCLKLRRADDGHKGTD